MGEKRAGARLRTVAAAVAMAGLAVVSTAQQASDPQGGSEPVQTFRMTTASVYMVFTVRDGQDRHITDLQSDQLSVTDNGQRQPITHFSLELDTALSLVVLFDKSFSVKSELDFEREATLSFIRSVLRRDKDEVALVTFDKRPQLATEFTDRSEDIEHTLSTVEAADGTALYDAARFAIEERLGRAGSSRKVLVMVTDGEDTVSWTTQKEVLELALSHNVVVYALGVRPDGSGRDQSVRKNLDKLSRESGGLALFPKHDPAELRARFQELEQELRHQYTLAYAMPPGEPAFHRVEIRSADRTHKIRSRVGYYPVTPAGSGTGVSR